MGKSYTVLSWKNRVKIMFGSIYDRHNHIILMLQDLRHYVWKSKAKKHYKRLFTEEELR